ncbi:hypothetical protein D0Z07_0165 [Hyphodiscus hymeniophilus]|uniref:Uncharacterized protein n=1 Tax=Hyphodiscus hymeniophilus TaxID=353542 RepID=A0A9P6VQY7_9HELO|nr:hypothetical protein D0Z07_0165 [Hyphodiscus hymeniophilus]
MDRQAADIIRLGPRIAAAERNIIGTMESIINIAVPDRVVEPRSAATTTSSSSQSTCSSGDNSARCEKPTNSSTFTLPIILGVVIPVVGAVILFLILQRRLVRKRREEDRNDRHASLDFGLGNVPQPGRPRKGPASSSEMEIGEKGSGHRVHQLSMELGVSSPYLLPPEVQNSRESLHSLSRTIHQNEDPYRPVSQYYPGDGASVRSQSKTRDGSSIYTGSSKAPSRFHDMSTSELLPNASRMSRSNPPMGGSFVPPPRQNSLPQKDTSPVESHASDTALPPPPYPVEPAQVHLPEPAVQAGIQRKGLPTNPRPGQSLVPASAPYPDTRDSFVSNDGTGLRASNNYLGAFIDSREPTPTPPSPPSKPAERELPDLSQNRMSPPAPKSLPTNPRPVRKESIPAVQQPHTFMDDESEYGNGFKVTPPSPGRGNAEMMRGQRFSMDVPPEQFAQAGLGAPGFDPRRLSMGFRPLPPDAVTESDDPELRANRIRSFYKEYFDESKPAPEGQYYEDYDENYLGDAAYYDPQQNSFVMPYAQPVTRRAMTPPPRGPRFQGPPRGRNGSMGAMSAGGVRPPGPRAFSSASGRPAASGPKRPIPPPMDLNSLPTPSKLRDDSFALTNAIDFAPPQTYRDRQAGRSESPFGERRPYSPSVPAFAPVVSAFDELAPIPSPHLLRNSATFTSLDFAPPKKFRDPDSMSDAGSIRSNQSGISSRQLGAIRNGAYRVSRIPKDVVSTKDDLMTSLKPSWGMRN